MYGINNDVNDVNFFGLLCIVSNSFIIEYHHHHRRRRRHILFSEQNNSEQLDTNSHTSKAAREAKRSLNWPPVLLEQYN